MKLKFGKLFTEEWVYPLVDGVGIRLTGKPNDIDMFIEILQNESCNPIATRRILNDLLEFGFRETTVMSHLNFIFISQELEKIGVQLSIIAPKKTNYDYFDDNESTQFLLGNKDLKDIKNKENFLSIAHLYEKNKNLGPYDPNFDIAAMLAKKNKRSGP